MDVLAGCTIVAIAGVCSPVGPGTPFATPLLALFDSARVLCLFLGVVLLFMIPAAIARCPTPGQWARFICMALWTLQTLTTEADNLGNDASFRLLFNVGAVLFGLYGVNHFRWESPGNVNRSRHRDT